MSFESDVAEMWDRTDSVLDFSVVISSVQGGLMRGSRADEILRGLRRDQLLRWSRGEQRLVESYLSELPSLPAGLDWRLELAVGELEARRATDRPLSEQEIQTRFPDLSQTLRSHESGGGDDVGGDGDADVTEVIRIADSEILQGRYRLERLLGQGNFGRVFLARDIDLQRDVAVKIPAEDRMSDVDRRREYLREARIVAGLEHPHILPIYDVGKTDSGAVYLVTRFIEGETLGSLLRRSRPAEREAVELLIPVISALGYAHRQGCVHRDVKPDNILLERRTGQPFLADFGLAIEESEYRHSDAVSGTPAYMSPEQVRGEGHRLDGRSDLFSVGVILYEVLTGQKPFRGGSVAEVLRSVRSGVLRPPQEVNEGVSSELQRICLRALSRLATDRYQTAAEMVEDLQAFLGSRGATAETATELLPRGLRAFDGSDSSFFLSLLPGIRNRAGLPESVAFWKLRLECRVASETFAVGLLYGPSGCGKSSLIRAGVLPRLSSDIRAICVDSTAAGTEERLRQELSRLVPEVSRASGLAETMSLLRRVRGRKLVVFLDQFEQWLSGNTAAADSELVLALRQCDGANLQVVLLIRDDFALAAGRFMRLVESRLVEGWNFAAVDLFDVEHTERVLGMFGRAYGRLPGTSEHLTGGQTEFLRDAARLLARDGRVISVHVAVFAEMMRRRVWISESLREVGGAEGIGVSFLEQMFFGREANPEHRLHAESARRVLKSMLPGVDREIRGARRTISELRSASGYGDSIAEFTQLLQILEHDLRLVTVTEGDGAAQGVAEVSYQLTHDFLVPSLRTWLSRKQRETVEGRAELLLEDRTASWTVRTESRQLPSFWEWLEICRRTDRGRWLDSERRMMVAAGRWHLRRGLTFGGICLIVLLCVGLLYRRADSAVRQQEVVGLVQGLRDARAAAVPTDVEALRLQAEYALPELRRQLLLVQVGTDQQMNLAAGLVALGEDVDAELLEAIEKLLLASRTEQLPVMSGIFRRLSQQLRSSLLGVLASGTEEPLRRLNAACLISTWFLGAGDAECVAALSAAAEFLAMELVKQRPTDVPVLQELLRPAFPQLIPVLTQVYSGKAAGPLQRAVALGVLADAVRDDSAALVELVMQSGEDSMGVLLPALERLSEEVRGRLLQVLQERPAAAWDDGPLDTAWKPLSAALKMELESCGGVVNDRSAMCLTLPFDRFLKIAEELRVCGYRPVRVRQVANVGAGAPRVSVVWRRDGRRWQLQTGLTSEQLPAADGDAVLDGLVPEEVSYVGGAGISGGWLLLWADPAEAGERRRIVAGVTAAEFRLSELGFTEGDFGLQLSLAVRLDESGVRRYAAVFSSQKRWSRSLTAWNGYEVLALPQVDCAAGAPGFELSEDPRERYRRKLKTLQASPAATQATAEFRQMRAELLASAGDALGALSDLDLVMSAARNPEAELLLRYLTLLALAGRSEDAAVVFSRLEQRGANSEELAFGQILLAASRGDSAEVLSAAERAEGVVSGKGERLFALSEVVVWAAQALHRRDPAVDSALVLDRGFELLRGALASGFNRGGDLDNSTAWSEYRGEAQFRELMILLRQRDVLAGVWTADSVLESRLVRADTTARVQAEVAAMFEEGWRAVSAGVSESGVGDSVVLLQRPLVKPELSERQASRHAMAQLLLLRLGAAESVWPAFTDRPDSRVRTGVLHGLSAAGVSAETLLDRLAVEQDAGVRRALIQGLGELVAAGQVSEVLRQRIQADLLIRLVADPDPGVHGMCAWTLRVCGADGEAAAALQPLATGGVEGGRGWYLTKTTGATPESGPHTLAIVDGTASFLMGSPLSEAGRSGGLRQPNQEPLHRRNLNRRFAIGMLEVTVSQYRAFSPDHTVSSDFSRGDDNPANRVTWYSAAEFCNWLSAQEGIPEEQWCYDPKQLFGSGMTLKPGFLELTGYRLPTAAEWELACRAGTTTARYFGESPQWMNSYAWWNGNMQEAVLKPCGQLRPNGFGLFDMYGNANEWVNDEAGVVEFGLEFLDGTEPAGSSRVSDLRMRLSRGGSFGDVAGVNRSAANISRQPGFLSGQHGLRVVRTLPADFGK